MPETTLLEEKKLPPALEKAMADVGEIASLPEITTKIVQVVEDPRATAHDMHEIVRSDPALAAKILRVVNSAFYGLPSQIASLDRAILMLGLSAVKNIALAASLSRMFNAEAVSAHFAVRDLWRHCVAVGVCSRMLGQVGTPAPTDEPFVGGLVHDVGLLAVQQLFPEKLKQVIEECYNTPQNFLAVEQSIIGADHEAFGGSLAAKWKFPPALRCAIMCHHEPGVMPPEFQKVAMTVCVADRVCCQGRYGLWLTAQTEEITEDMLDAIGVTPANLQDIAEHLPEAVEEAEQVFA